MNHLAHQFGQVVRARREAAGVSQEALARAAGLDRSYVGMIERGESTPTVATVHLLAEALGTSMTSLISELERSLTNKKG